MIALKDSIEIYAWAPKPYHKFMAFKSFPDVIHKPLLVDMTIEEGIRLKVIYGSTEGFHAVDLDCGAVYDIYVPAHVSITYSLHLLLLNEFLKNPESCDCDAHTLFLLDSSSLLSNLLFSTSLFLLSCNLLLLLLTF